MFPNNDITVDMTRLGPWWSPRKGEDGGYIALVISDMPYAMYTTQLWEPPGGTQNHDDKGHLNARQDGGGGGGGVGRLGSWLRPLHSAIVAMSVEDSEMVESRTTTRQLKSLPHEPVRYPRVPLGNMMILEDLCLGGKPPWNVLIVSDV